MKTKNKKKISTREGAIRIASVAANTPDYFLRTNYTRLRDELQLSSASERLASEAWAVVIELLGEAWGQVVDAEVEGLLRSGWSPGDEVYLIAPVPEQMPHHVGATDEAGTESDPDLVRDLDDAAERIVASRPDEQDPQDEAVVKIQYAGYPACAGNDPDEEEIAPYLRAPEDGPSEAEKQEILRQINDPDGES